MIPYYEDGACTIYHAKAEDMIPRLGYEVLITDPPYGTGWARGGQAVGKWKPSHQAAEWDIWSTEWITEKVLKHRVAILCPCSRLKELANCFPNPKYRFWVKTNPRPGCNSDSPSVEPIVIHPKVLNPSHGQHWLGYNGDNSDHPTTKPLELMKWLVLGMSDVTEIILDPFMGSGTTLRAAKELARRAIGVDISERYCEIAAKRLAQEVLKL